MRCIKAVSNFFSVQIEVIFKKKTTTKIQFLR